MLCVFAPHIFNAEAINNKAETDGARLIGPQTWSTKTRVVPVEVKLLPQELLHKDACLRQAINA